MLNYKDKGLLYKMFFILLYKNYTTKNSTQTFEIYYKSFVSSNKFKIYNN